MQKQWRIFLFFALFLDGINGQLIHPDGLPALFLHNPAGGFDALLIIGLIMAVIGIEILLVIADTDKIAGYAFRKQTLNFCGRMKIEQKMAEFLHGQMQIIARPGAKAVIAAQGHIIR